MLGMTAVSELPVSTQNRITNVIIISLCNWKIAAVSQIVYKKNNNYIIGAEEQYWQDLIRCYENNIVIPLPTVNTVIL